MISLRSRIAIWLTLSALLWVGIVLACFWLVHFAAAATEPGRKLKHKWRDDLFFAAPVADEEPAL